MESWRTVWRDGMQPGLSTRALTALLHGLRTDSPQLIQGATTTPPPLMCVQDWDVEAADAIGYAGWKGEELESVGSVEEFFAKTCFESDQRTGNPADCRFFLNWFDDSPRSEMLRELSAEVEAELCRRGVHSDSVPAELVTALERNPLDAGLYGAVADYLRGEGLDAVADVYAQRSVELVEDKA